MSDKINDGGPAFPSDGDNSKRRVKQGNGLIDYVPNHGMSLRDWFAGMALQGMLCNGFQPGQCDPQRQRSGLRSGFLYTQAAYELADAMLRAREEGRS